MATQNELFKINISQVLRYIWSNDKISRVEIAKALQMDKSTVTKIVSYLLDIGIIKTLEEGDAKPSGGRKPVPLSINITYGCILGIEIQTDSYYTVVLDLHGEVISRRNEEINFDEKNLTEMFFYIVEISKTTTDKYGLLGVVVGISGLINSNAGIILKSNPLSIYSEFDFCGEIKKSFDIPVIIENDANCCCWGELTSLKTKRPDNMLFILGEFREVEIKHNFYSGIGFGFGIVINGKVYYGNEYSAGEFKSLYSRVPSISQFSLDDNIIENIQEKPEELMKLLRELCKNLSLIVNFFNIQDIVVGGAIEQYRDMIELMLSQEIQSNWSYPDQMKYCIRSSNENTHTVAYGAACMFLEQLFSIPEMNKMSKSNSIHWIEERKLKN